MKNAVLRDRGLIKIKDQLGSYRLVLKGLRGIQRSRNLEFAANSFINVNQKSFDALEILPSISFEKDNIGINLKTNGIIGAVPLYSSETRKINGGVIVEPKFGWNDIGPLLTSIGWAAAPQLLSFPMIPGSAKEIPPWVLAGPIIERISHLLDNINRGFSLTKETRESPRGTIIWKDYISESVANGKYNKLPCIFPDLNEDNKLRSYIRWGLEKLKFSLLGCSQLDSTSLILIENIEVLLTKVRDVRAVLPTKNSLDLLKKGNIFSSIIFSNGIEAISWIRDDRGLAGQREPDGLAWKMVMSDLFEKWVEAVVRNWASNFGGTVKTGRQDSSRHPIRWENRSIKSLSNLIPDITVETEDTIYIFDAKYKKLYEELDDKKWRELSKELQEEHRHDIHQVLAYASLFNKPRIVSILVYPLTDNTYTTLLGQSKLLNRAVIPIENNALELGIFGVPLSVNNLYGIKDISMGLDFLNIPLAT